MLPFRHVQIHVPLDLRGTRRFATRRAARLAVDGCAPEMPVVVRNVSHRGLQVAWCGAPSPGMSRGTPVVARLMMVEGAAEIPGHIVWAYDDGDTWTAGIRLSPTAADFPSRRAYERWMAALEGSRPAP